MGSTKRTRIYNQNRKKVKMKKLKKKIIKRELRKFLEYRIYYEECLLLIGFCSAPPSIPHLLIRHGFEFESIEEPRKAKLLYPDGKLKVVEF